MTSAQHSSASNEHYTPPAIIEAAHVIAFLPPLEGAAVWAVGQFEKHFQPFGRVRT